MLTRHVRLCEHQFTGWLRTVPVDPDLSLNLLASELTVAAVRTPLPQSA